MPAGRPTKYMKIKTPALVRAFTKRMDYETVFEFSNYGLAVELGITYETFKQWRKDPEKAEFSSAVNELDAKRAAVSTHRCMKDKDIAPGKACFLLKNWTEMRDKVEYDVGFHGQAGVMMYGSQGRGELTPEEFEEEVTAKHGNGVRKD